MMLLIVFLGGPVVHRGCQICGRAARVIFRDIAECHPQAAIRVWTPPGTGLTESVRARLLGLLGTPLVELLKLVSKLPEADSQELGRAGLHAAHALQGQLHVTMLDTGE